MASWLSTSLTRAGEQRDSLAEKLFLATYGSPLLQALVGLDAEEVASKKAIERDLNREEIGRRKLAELDASFEEGGLAEAVVRAVAYVRAAEDGVDERIFAVMQEIYAECPPEQRVAPAELKAIMAEQRALVLRNAKRALMTLPALLHDSQARRDEALGDRPAHRHRLAIRSRPRASAASPGSNARSAAHLRRSQGKPAAMSEIRPLLTGHKSLIVGDRQRGLDRLRLRQRRSARPAPTSAVTWLNDKARGCTSSRSPTQLGAQIKAAAQRRDPRRARGGVRRNRARAGASSIASSTRSPTRPREDLQGGLLDCSAEGFARAMDVSCHSFVRMARLAAPLMPDGGTLFAMSYVGANRVVANYNVMGPVKAALEAACRYLAYELGPRNIRVHAISPGPLKTARRLGHQGLRAAAQPGRRRDRPSASWSTSTTSATPAPTSPRPSPTASPAGRSISTAGRTS